MSVMIFALYFFGMIQMWVICDDNLFPKSRSTFWVTIWSCLVWPGVVIFALVGTLYYLMLHLYSKLKAA